MSFLGIHFGFYNLLSCTGFLTNTSANMGPVGFDIGSPCMLSKLGLVILFFIIAITRKWGGEEMGIDFNFWWAAGLGIGLYILAVTFTGSTKLAMILGILGMLIGGYAMGFFTGGSDEPNYG